MCPQKNHFQERSWVQHVLYLAVFSILQQMNSDTDPQGNQPRTFRSTWLPCLSAGLINSRGTRLVCPLDSGFALACFLIKPRTSSPACLYQLSVKKMPYRFSVWWGYFLNWSLFSDDSSLCQVNKNPVSTALKTNELVTFVSYFMGMYGSNICTCVCVRACPCRVCVGGNACTCVSMCTWGG